MPATPEFLSEFEYPQDLLCDGDKYDDAGSPRSAWMAALPEVVGELSRRWSLKLGRPFQPGGSASWVAPARDAAGTPLVLKVGWRHDEAEHEAEGLRVWRGNGTVRLIDALMLGDNNALLLERCDPGAALAGLLPADEQDVAVSGARGRTRDWPRPAFVTLPGSADRSVLLCTDLHPDKVLAARREPWLAIDPKPYLGDLTYDPLQHMLNCPDRLSPDPVAFARRMAELLDLDAGRLEQWLFARCVQESLDDPDLAAVARVLARSRS